MCSHAVFYSAAHTAMPTRLRPVADARAQRCFASLVENPSPVRDAPQEFGRNLANSHAAWRCMAGLRAKERSPRHCVGEQAGRPNFMGGERSSLHRCREASRRRTMAGAAAGRCLGECRSVGEEAARRSSLRRAVACRRRTMRGAATQRCPALLLKAVASRLFRASMTDMGCCI
eukprot:NODE_8433_length_1496_cov_4.203798.p3 GENE.NODE_8433_length_1496_cov_4.203798~~NODE_8433_length_1496_cov_4.203798.p3  ORF type:complete len:174 (-),score=18.91 NODE_8433_length_1496_cov_4.203798:748-1269(-)